MAAHSDTPTCALMRETELPGVQLPWFLFSTTACKLEWKLAARQKHPDHIPGDLAVPTHLMLEMVFRKNQLVTCALKKLEQQQAQNSCTTRGSIPPHAHCAPFRSIPHRRLREMRPVFLGSILKLYHCLASASSSKAMPSWDRLSPPNITLHKYSGAAMCLHNCPAGNPISFSPALLPSAAVLFGDVCGGEELPQWQMQ